MAAPGERQAAPHQVPRCHADAQIAWAATGALAARDNRASPAKLNLRPGAGPARQPGADAVVMPDQPVG
jgi:hypothetical protein